MEFKIKAKLVTREDLRRIITRLAHEILEKNRGVEDLVIIGIRTRGAYIAQRLAKKIKQIEKMGDDQTMFPMLPAGPANNTQILDASGRPVSGQNIALFNKEKTA